MHAHSHLQESSLTVALKLVAELDGEERLILEAMLHEAQRFQRTRPTGYVSESVETIARIVGEAVLNHRELATTTPILTKM